MVGPPSDDVNQMAVFLVEVQKCRHIISLESC